MAIFDRNYDREYGYRTGGLGNDRTYRMGGGQMGYDRMYGGTSMGYDRNYGYVGGEGYGYDRGYKSRWETDYGDPFGDRQSHTPIRMVNEGGRMGYDREMRTNDRDFYGYDRNYTVYDRNYTGMNRENVGYNRMVGYNRTRSEYGSDYSTNPMSYDPYYPEYGTVDRENLATRGYDRGFRGRSFRNRYDSGLY